MNKLRYWRIVHEETYEVRNTTMLASGDTDKDIENLKKRADLVGGVSFELWESDSAKGFSPHPDGKDMFRDHKRIMEIKG